MEVEGLVANQSSSFRLSDFERRAVGVIMVIPWAGKCNLVSHGGTMAKSNKDGIRVRYFRTKRGISLEEMDHRCGLSPLEDSEHPATKLWEKGVSDPQFQWPVAKEALGVDDYEEAEFEVWWQENYEEG